MAATLVATPASGQAPPPQRSIDDPSNADFIATTERDEDPLGIESGMQRALESAAQEGAERARAQADRPALTARQGQVVSAIGAVRESRHEAHVSWAQGLQRVEVHVQLESRSRFAAEVAYRLALPAHARVVSVALCVEPKRCREGHVAGDARARYESLLGQTAEAPSPALLATRIVDERGHALALRVAPLPPGQQLELRVTNGIERPVRGGVVRLELPPRGFDPRTAPTDVQIEAPDLALQDDSRTFSLDPWLPLELPVRFAPRSPAGLRGALRARTDGRTRERRWRATPLSPDDDSPLALWVLVDRSPSMEGPARGRVLPALHALRDSLPQGSQLRVAVFDASARELPEAFAADFDARLQRALLQPSGAKTRLSAALRLTRDWQANGKPVRAVILSDGRLTTEHGELSALRRFGRRGIPTWLVSLELPGLDGDRARLLEALDGKLVDASAEADRALQEREPGPLRERLSQVLHARPGAANVPGEQQVRWGPARGSAPRGDPAFAHLLAARDDGPWTTLDPDAHQGLWPAGQPDAPAPPYVDAPPARAAPPTGMPAESVLALLRDQLVPKARACLRRDRRGRADYAVRAAFVFRLERREILDAEVQGQLEPELRRCLRGVMADLDVPAFSGRLAVRYPIHTQREQEPPQIELTPDTAARLERLFESERPGPPPAGLASPGREAW